MKPYVIWQLGQMPEKTEIDSSQMPDDLDLKARKNKTPFCVQVCLSDESALMMTIGVDISHLEYYSKSHRPPGVVSVGDLNEPEEAFVILHGGAPSMIQKKSCVPIENARNAVKQYLETGKGPAHIKWIDE